ncbi:hypothetical protein RAA17_10445 [Komagataeibacter rhaeticus]|nr:hypothetical protein [Komagataeibacter rhaeticus]
MIKTGVVSVMNGDSAEKVTYTPQTAGEGTDTDPTTTFNAAGSVGGLYIGSCRWRQRPWRGQ